MTTTMLIAALVIPIVRLLVFQSSSEKATRLGEDFVFKPTKAIELLYSVSMFFFSVLSVWTLVGRQDWWISGIFIFFVLLAMVTWPPTIVLTENGICARRLLGGSKFLNWSSLDVVQEYRNPLVLILKQGKLKISFTSYYRDPSRFETEVRRHFRQDFERCKHPHA